MKSCLKTLLLSLMLLPSAVAAHTCPPPQEHNEPGPPNVLKETRPCPRVGTDAVKMLVYLDICGDGTGGGGSLSSRPTLLRESQVESILHRAAAQCGLDLPLYLEKHADDFAAERRRYGSAAIGDKAMCDCRRPDINRMMDRYRRTFSK